MHRVIAVAALSLAVPVHAELLDRGNGLLYDTVQNLTWLQDASYFASLTALPAPQPDPNAATLANGAYLLEGVYRYFDMLDAGAYKGITTWRMPVAFLDPAKCLPNTTQCSSDPVTGSELSVLANEAGALALLGNVKQAAYLTGTTFDIQGQTSIAYYDLAGKQAQEATWDSFTPGFVLPVADGDLAPPVAPVPEPSTAALMALGLAAVGVAARSRKTRPGPMR